MFLNSAEHKKIYVIYLISSGAPAHQLSASRLISSPDPQRHRLDEPAGL